MLVKSEDVVELSIRIGDIEAKRGTKESGFLRVAETSAYSVKLPITVIHGSKPGPNLCLTAGMHATEYAGIEASTRIVQEVKPEGLSGTLTVVHLVNVPGFLARSPVCPIDNINIYYVFPGEKKGSMSHLIANTLFTEVISKANYYIDLHGGFIEEEMSHWAIKIRETRDRRVDDASKDMCKYFLVKYIYEYELDEGTLHTSIGAAVKAGIPAMLVEAGGVGIYDENDIAFLKNGILNVMKHLKMLEGAPRTITDQKRVTKRHLLRAKRGGFFAAEIKAGSLVSKGQIIGKLKDLFGQTLDTPIAPAGGVILYRMTPSAVSTGDPLLYIGELEPF